MKILPKKTTSAQLCLVFLLAVLLTAGCTSPMPLKHTVANIKLDKKSIILFTIKTTNDYKPSYPLFNIEYIEIVASDTGKNQKFKVGKAITESGNTCEYLINMDVNPGKYTIRDIRGLGGSFWGLFVGRFLFPVNGTFEVSENSVTYIGHVDMINRKRNKDEPRSGSIIPLMDQSAAGFSDGTIDVSISDQFNSDIPRFKQAYSCLQNVQISKTLMQKK